MAARKKSDTSISGILSMIGTLVMLPVLALSLAFYIYYYFRYISGGERRRVMDIRRMGAPIIKGAVFLGAVLALFIFVLPGENSAPLIPPHIFLLMLMGMGVFVALHLAMMYVNVVGDPQKDRLVFPPDMQSYGIFDYLFLRFVLDYCRVDTVPLSAIERITRGYGTDLYIHGDFGSRGIFLSSKQKRDECMAMIQDLAGKRGLVFGEMESY